MNNSPIIEDSLRKTLGQRPIEWTNEHLATYEWEAYANRVVLLSHLPDVSCVKKLPTSPMKYQAGRLLGEEVM